jgi:hypothetical protein
MVTCFSAKSLMTSGVWKASEIAARIASRNELRESITLKSPLDILAREVSNSLKDYLFLYEDVTF